MSNARYLGLTANQLAKMASELEAKNARLRELCADMLSEDMDQHWPEFTRRALELGVEVEP